MSPSGLHPRYEIVEHTADFGIVGQAATLNALFEVMARGLFRLVAEGEIPGVRVERDVVLTADTPAALLRAWLKEINGLHQEHREIYGGFDAAVHGCSLRGRVRGEPIEARHGVQHEVKGVTWHDLAVERVPGGHRAYVLLDV